MTERPILFARQMAHAIDHNDKTVTRRTRGLETVNAEPDSYTPDYLGLDSKGNFVVRFQKYGTPVIQKFIKCPYGNIGDLLWVRETFFKNGDEYIYLANGTCCEQFEQCECIEVGKPKWKPSIHMPKEAARLWLRITDIRVERLQQISAHDAVNEGIGELARWPELPDRPRYITYGKVFQDGPGEAATFDPIFSFFSLWISINGGDSVLKNPWVWAVTFEKLTDPEVFTVEGYAVMNLAIKPDSEVNGRYPLPPLIFKGLIRDTKHGGQHMEVEWDENGKCSNWQRPDCFLNIKQLKVWVNGRELPSRPQFY